MILSAYEGREKGWTVRVPSPEINQRVVDEFLREMASRGNQPEYVAINVGLGLNFWKSRVKLYSHARGWPLGSIVILVDGTVVEQYDNKVSYFSFESDYEYGIIDHLGAMVDYLSVRNSVPQEPNKPRHFAKGDNIVEWVPYPGPGQYSRVGW